MPLHPTLALLLCHLALLTLTDQSKSCICNQFAQSSTLLYITFAHFSLILPPFQNLNNEDFIYQKRATNHYLYSGTQFVQQYIPKTSYIVVYLIVTNNMLL